VKAAVDPQTVAAIRKGLDLIEESIAAAAAASTAHSHGSKQASAPSSSAQQQPILLKIYIYTGSKSYY
jgi:hypothetical protein